MKLCRNHKQRAGHLRMVADFFDKVPVSSIDQQVGVMYPAKKCAACVGTWLAVFYEVMRMQVSGKRAYYYRDGRDQLAFHLAVVGPDLDRLLRSHGAAGYPWGRHGWESQPADVFRSAATAFEAKKGAE